jgi:hypothetical protein
MQRTKPGQDGASPLISVFYGRRNLMADARKLEQDAMRQRGRELRALLNQWDPIGVMGPEAPPDDTEYDDLLWPLMRLLEGGASAADLDEHLRRKLDSDYGFTPNPTEVQRVARRIKEWFDQKWINTRA